jgi:formyl-CoA transferase
VFRCQDGKLLAVHLSSQAKFWEGLLEALGRQDLASHPDFAERPNRIRNYERLRDELARTCGTRPRAEWTSRLEASDVPYAPVNDVADVFDDPQVRHLSMFTNLRHPSEGDVCCVQPPIWVDGERPGAASAPPVLGEHTDAVLSELGHGADDIAALRAAKVV